VSAQADALEPEVRALVARILRLDATPSIELRRDVEARWDSLRHVEIVFALEDRYGVRFDESEFAALASTSAIAARLRAHLEA
jgi:acyl carrier protein